jgi:hypothetical protein
MWFHRSTAINLWLVLIGMLLMAPTISSVQTGVGEAGENGCTCHGGEFTGTVVSIEGLPSAYEVNTTYNLTIFIDSTIDLDSTNYQGGFRLATNGVGTIVFADTNEVQVIQEGWTHTENGTYQRSWNLSWSSPETPTKAVEFILIGNAVNGNLQSSGDGWNSFAKAIPHVDDNAQLDQPVVHREIDTLDLAVFVVGLSAMCFFLVRTMK